MSAYGRRYLMVDGVIRRVSGTGPATLTKPSRDDLPAYGTYMPIESVSAGLLPGVGLLEVPGNQTISSPGTYENRHFLAKVSVTTSGLVTFKNCRFSGPVIAPRDPLSDDSSQGCLQATNAAVLDLRLIDCLVQPASPANAINGFKGHHLSAYRTVFRYGCDGLNWTKSGGGALANSMYGCIVDELVFWKPSVNGGATRTEGTHNDCLAIEGGTGHTLVGNVLSSYYSEAYGNPETNDYFPYMCGTSAIIVIANQAAISGVTIDRNWIYGGAAGINVATSTVTGLTITNNRFDMGHRVAPILIAGAAFDAATVSGNTRMDTGASVSASRG